MFQIIIGSSLLSLSHSLIPHHWLPLALAGKSENWSAKETALITLLIGMMHTFSTIIIGIVIGIIGHRLMNTFQSLENILAPAVLTGLGIFFIIKNFTGPGHHHHDKHESHRHDHSTHHHLSEKETKTISKKSKKAIISAIGTMMIFSPCIEIEAFYFTAGKYGWTGITILSVIYFIITISVMISCVLLGKKGLDLINRRLHFFEHHSRAIAGSVLITLGLLSSIIQF
jgi:nickel/cobalt transporter (NicO) family protein